MTTVSPSKTDPRLSDDTKVVGRSSTMNTPNKKNNIEFVPFVHPQDSRGRRGVKQQIRLHIARIQHEQSDRKRRPYELQPWTLTSNLSTTNDSNEGYQDATVEKDVRLIEEEKDNNSKEMSKLEEHNLVRLVDVHKLPLLSSNPVGSTEEDPFWTYPIPYSPLSSRMVAHYIQCLTLPVPELDGPQSQGLLRSYWFPLALTYPATMYAVLLMAASHHRLECEASSVSSQVNEKDILSLKGCALHEINRAFRSRNVASSISDAMIGAVAKLAVFEALFGDVQVFQRHMAGLNEMIRLRQKHESTMGTLDMFVRKLVFWIDLNASYLTGIPRTFSGKKDMLVIETQIKEPNPTSFAGTAKALEKLWLIKLKLGNNPQGVPPGCYRLSGHSTVKQK